MHDTIKIVHGAFGFSALYQKPQICQEIFYNITRKVYRIHYRVQKAKKPIVALLGDFGYSQNGGGTLSDFMIFFFLHGYISS